MYLVFVFQNQKTDQIWNYIF